MNEGREIWEARIKAQRESELAQKAWCEREGISHNTMQGWIKRLGLQQHEHGSHHKAPFVKAVTQPPKKNEGATDTPGAIEMTVIKIRMPISYGQEALSRLLCEMTEQ
jgi:hypothetical protein